MVLDEYLRPNALIDTLLYKYQKHGRLIIACDFDRTLYDSKETGQSYEMVRQLIRELYASNCYIIIWTGNPNIYGVSTFLIENNIPYHSINEDAPFVEIELLGRKIYADVFIDDRAGLREVHDTLNRFLIEIK